MNFPGQRKQSIALIKSHRILYIPNLSNSIVIINHQSRGHTICFAQTQAANEESALSMASSSSPISCRWDPHDFTMSWGMLCNMGRCVQRPCTSKNMVCFPTQIVVTDQIGDIYSCLAKYPVSLSPGWLANKATLCSFNVMLMFNQVGNAAYCYDYSRNINCSNFRPSHCWKQISPTVSLRFKLHSFRLRNKDLEHTRTILFIPIPCLFGMRSHSATACPTCPGSETSSWLETPVSQDESPDHRCPWRCKSPPPTPGSNDRGPASVVGKIPSKPLFSCRLQVELG